jgi:hypothetical protein
MMVADARLNQGSYLNISRVNPHENEESFLEEVKELVE